MLILATPVVSMAKAAAVTRHTAVGGLMEGSSELRKASVSASMRSANSCM
jgi:hypothetical protein